MKELAEMSKLELLQFHSDAIAELRRRGVVRTKDNPIGGYAEWLVCKRLGLEQVQGVAQKSFDACDSNGKRYQIKGRRSEANSVAFSPNRKLDQHGFDFLIAVIFHENYSVRLAVKVPYAEVCKVARYARWVNGHVPRLTNSSVDLAGVEDITKGM